MRKSLFRCSCGVLLVAALAAWSGCSKSARAGRHLERGQRALAAGNYDEADVEFQNVLQEDPVNAAALAQLGILYFQEGRLARAVPLLTRARELGPDNLELRNEYGTALLSAGKYAEARQEALYVLQRRPGDARAPLTLARAAVTPADVAAARSVLQGLPPGAGQPEALAVAEGLLDWKGGDATGAEASFRRAVAANPKSPEAHAALAAWYRGQRDLAHADAELAAAAANAPLRSPFRLEYAQFKFAQGDAAAARRVLQEALAGAPDYLPALIALAEIDFSEKKYDASRALLAKVAARDNIQPDALLLAARILLAEGEFAKAATGLEQLCANFPQFAAPFYYLATAEIAAGELPKAADNLGQAIRLSPDYADAILLQANLNTARGNLFAAGAALEGLVRRRPDLFAAWTSLADVRMRQNNFAGARAVFDEAAKFFPENAQTAVLRGQSYLRENDPGHARAAFARALELTPDFRPAQEGLVAIDLGAGNYDAALARLREILHRNPAETWPHLDIGRILVRQKQWDAAEAEMRGLTVSAPDLAEPYFRLAEIYYEKHEVAKALASLKENTAKDPKNFQAYMLIGLLSEREQQFAAARTAYEHALAINPRAGVALNNVAYIYSERDNNLDKAYEMARRAREVLPLDPGVEDTLGWILFKRGQYLNAVALLRESAEKLPASADAQAHLGDALALVGDEAGAKAALTRALAIDPAFSGSAAARQRLKYLEIDPATATPAAAGQLRADAAHEAEDPVLGVRLAALYERDGDGARARALLEKLQATFPQDAAVGLGLAGYYARHNQAAQALTLGKSLRQQFPDNRAVNRALGRLLLDVGDYAGAFGILQGLRAERLDDPEVVLDFARAAYCNGRAAEADEAVGQVMAAAPANTPLRAEATEFQALVRLVAQGPASAADRALLDRQAREHPDAAMTLAVRAGEENRAGNPVAELATLARLLESYPAFLPAQRRLAILASRKGTPDEAGLRVAAKAHQAFPDDPEVTKAYGILLYRQDEFPRASALLTEASAQLGQDAETFFFLGQAQEKASRHAEAVAAWKKALALGLPAPLAAQARDNLGTKG